MFIDLYRLHISLQESLFTLYDMIPFGLHDSDRVISIIASKPQIIVFLALMKWFDRYLIPIGSIKGSIDTSVNCKSTY